jgi:hypothetical protein
MYISKVNSLCELHMSLSNYVEAALCVMLHSDELEWHPSSSLTQPQQPGPQERENLKKVASTLAILTPKGKVVSQSN